MHGPWLSQSISIQWLRRVVLKSRRSFRLQPSLCTGCPTKSRRNHCGVHPCCGLSVVQGAFLGLKERCHRRVQHVTVSCKQGDVFWPAPGANGNLPYALTRHALAPQGGATTESLKPTTSKAWLVYARSGAYGSRLRAGSWHACGVPRPCSMAWCNRLRPAANALSRALESARWAWIEHPELEATSWAWDRLPVLEPARWVGDQRAGLEISTLGWESARWAEVWSTKRMLWTDGMVRPSWKRLEEGWETGRAS